MSNENKDSNTEVGADHIPMKEKDPLDVALSGKYGYEEDKLARLMREGATLTLEYSAAHDFLNNFVEDSPTAREVQRIEADLKDEADVFAQQYRDSGPIDEENNFDYMWMLCLFQGKYLGIAWAWRSNETAELWYKKREDGTVDYNAFLAYDETEDRVSILADDTFDKDKVMDNENTKRPSVDLKLIEKAVESAGLGKGSKLDQAIQEATAGLGKKQVPDDGLRGAVGMEGGFPVGTVAAIGTTTSSDKSQVEGEAVHVEGRNEPQVSQPNVQVTTMENPTAGEDGVRISKDAEQKFDPETFEPRVVGDESTTREKATSRTGGQPFVTAFVKIMPCDVVQFLSRYMEDDKEVEFLTHFLIYIDEHIHGHRTLTEMALTDIANLRNYGLLDKMVEGWGFYSVPRPGCLTLQLLPDGEKLRYGDKPGLQFSIPFHRENANRLMFVPFTRAAALMGLHSNPRTVQLPQAILTMLCGRGALTLGYNDFITGFLPNTIRGVAIHLRERLQDSVDEITPNKENIQEIQYILHEVEAGTDSVTKKPYYRVTIQPRVTYVDRSTRTSYEVPCNAVYVDGEWAISHSTDCGGPWNEGGPRGMFHEPQHGSVGGFASPLREARYGQHHKALHSWQEPFQRRAAEQRAFDEQARELASKPIWSNFDSSRYQPLASKPLWPSDAMPRQSPPQPPVKAADLKEPASISTNNRAMFEFFLSGIPAQRMRNPAGFQAFRTLLAHYTATLENSKEVVYSGRLGDHDAPLDNTLFTYPHLQLSVSVNGQCIALYEDHYLR